MSSTNTKALLSRLGPLWAVVAHHRHYRDEPKLSHRQQYFERVASGFHQRFDCLWHDVCDLTRGIDLSVGSTWP